MTKSQETIIAILSELEESGIRSLTVTSLVKFVYLVDYAQAKSNAGATFTDLHWRFLHFGPFDGAVMDDLTVLDSRRALDLVNGGDTQRDYQIYQLTESVTRKTLEAIGVTKRAAGMVKQWLQSYARDQSKLLNFVYYDTEPMAEAQPQDLLDFSVCRADNWKDIKPIAAKPLPAAAVKAYRERLAARNLREAAQKRPPIVWEGAFDEAYHRAMAILDSDDGGAMTIGNSGVLVL
jgi:hypothetical protein